MKTLRRVRGSQALIQNSIPLILPRLYNTRSSVSIYLPHNLLSPITVLFCFFPLIQLIFMARISFIVLGEKKKIIEEIM
ncbi:hypothetical protein VNO80_28651 [Phaseolus coccineus]|uniref:Uncharacterized protein n=1 Tax=Phaseolus coccineus TaxID=3886 RepID=A0AAN9QHS3_PHACN